MGTGAGQRSSLPFVNFFSAENISRLLNIHALLYHIILFVFPYPFVSTINSYTKQSK